jgi:acetoacetyl-CoA synthetase
MPAASHIPRIRRYQDWLFERHGLKFDNHEALWHWSVTELDAFWQSIWDFEGFESPTPHTAVLAKAQMPGAVWFPGAQANYAQRVLRHVDAAEAAGVPAIISDNELGQVRQMGWAELRRQVASLALSLQDLGVQPGDRVVAYLPNVPETVVAFLACASIGAIWSVCAPDMGAQAVIDRFSQIRPRVLIATDGVFYAGKAIDRSSFLKDLRAALPTVEHLLLLPSPHADQPVDADSLFAQAISRTGPEVDHFQPRWLPFDHPLWVLYSSGTTGLPKALVHGHGGVAIAVAANSLHIDTGPSYQPEHWQERLHWYSSTGWVMWNFQVGALMQGTTICIFDGSPGGSKAAPDWSVLWRFAAKHQVTSFGAGAAFYASCLKAGLQLQSCGDLSRLTMLGSTGSPLSAEAQQWGTQQLALQGRPHVWWNNLSGGTDFVAALVGGHRELPSPEGRMPCRWLGAAVQAWNDAGQSVVGEVGELVCTQPLPSMPLYLWGDQDHARYLSSYFDVYPGIWRHGDWIRIDADGTCTIYGRSDATLNRQGLRMGTSELYAAVEALPEVVDTMVIDLEYLERPSRMILFAVLREGLVLNDETTRRIREAIAQAVSPRFVPDVILQAPEVPRTLSGKKQEVPIKKLFLGHPLHKVVNPEAMANPGCLAWYEAASRA